MTGSKSKERGFGISIGKRVLEAIGEDIEGVAVLPLRKELAQRGAALSKMSGGCRLQLKPVG